MSEPVFLEWQHMTGRQIDAIPRERAVVTVTCSPLEVHGPHLPTITDVAEARAINVRAMELLKERHPEILFLRLPPIYVAADVLPHVGSVMFRSSTITRTLEDLGRSLCRQGFRNLWVGSFHGGPRHFVPIEVAAHRVNQRHGGRMVSIFSLLLNRLTGGSTDLDQVLGHVDGVSPADLIGDAHAGVVETSIMLHLMGQHVDPVWAALVQRTVDLKLAEAGKAPLATEGRPTVRELFRGFKEKLKYYEDETYSGRPEVADPRLGKEFLDILGGHCADALGELWRGELDLADCHSPVWPYRWAFTERWLGWLFERAVRYRTRVW
ncbi:MAG: creatininase family protein [Alphaproteobacteria bacterium]|nr:creatininase family protein [Alphaproteobacteria bacterium]